MLGLASLLYVERAYDSFAAAGFVSAAALTGEAIASILQGRIMDRLGPTRPLLVISGLYLLAGLGLILAVERHLAVPVLVALSLVLGVTSPALPGASRSLWSQLVPPGSQREAALTYEAISLETFFILGPGAAGLLLLAPWPGTGLAVAVTMMFVGAICFALTSTVRRYRPVREGVRSGWGALASPGMRVMPLAALGFGCVVGVVEVGVPAVTSAEGHPALAGVLLSAWSVASVVAGLLYGLHPWPTQLRHRLPVLLVGFSLTVVAMGLLPGLAGLIVAMLLAGCLITPQVTAQSLTVELVAPPGTGTEAFGWVVTATTLGIGSGYALGGPLVQAYGPDTAFFAGGASGLLLAALLWLLRRHLIIAAEPRTPALTGDAGR